MQALNIFWFRRDLRIEDNAALYHALKGDRPVLPIFIFDIDILNKLEDRTDARVSFIHQTILGINEKLIEWGTALRVFHGSPIEVFKSLINEFEISEVFTNEDYEKYGMERDKNVNAFCNENKIRFSSFKDHVIFAKNEVLKDDGKPYTIFTPYSRKWKATLKAYYYQAYPIEKYQKNFLQILSDEIISLEAMGFEKSKMAIPNSNVSEELIKKYSENRDYPAKPGTSKLGIHLRFGTISIRALLAKALPLNETFVNELIWRDFYHAILFHFPQINDRQSFKKEYDAIVWRNNETEFRLWCNGQTGYPIVDAGMRELNETGFMHNRVRMIVASFLTKHLLIDWRWGEAYFANKLLDYDFAANNGGWQWAAGSGCDAAPYFRVFNPTLQTQKFDGNMEYIKKWVPEFQELNYRQIVEHSHARERCLAHYGKYLTKKGY